MEFKIRRVIQFGGADYLVCDKETNAEIIKIAITNLTGAILVNSITTPRSKNYNELFLAKHKVSLERALLLAVVRDYGSSVLGFRVNTNFIKDPLARSTLETALKSIDANQRSEGIFRVAAKTVRALKTEFKASPLSPKSALQNAYERIRNRFKEKPK